MSKCKHLTFASTVEVTRLTENGRDDEPADAYRCDVRVQCATCGETFCFVGLPFGLSPDQPTMGADEEEARLILRPSSETVKAFGPGFAIKNTTPRKGVN